MKRTPDYFDISRAFCVGIAVVLHAQYLLHAKSEDGTVGLYLGWCLYVVAFLLGAWRGLRGLHGDWGR